MLKLYDQKSDIRFPLATRTAGEMRAMPAYKVLFEGASVIDVSEEGIATGFGLLSDYKARFGVTEADPERALSLVIEAQEKATKAQAEGANEPATVAQLQVENQDLKAQLQVENQDLKAQLEEQAAAIKELAAIVAEMKG